MSISFKINDFLSHAFKKKRDMAMNDKLKSCFKSLNDYYNKENNILVYQEVDKFLKIDNVATLQLQQNTPFYDFVAGWSTPNGNGLYNAVSFLLNGNESSNNTLRLLTSMELFQHAEFYATHRIFEDACTPPSNYSNNMFFILALSGPSSVSFDGTLRSRIECVKSEAIRNCDKGTPASFMCMLAMASVVKRPINSIYPVFKHVEKSILKNRTLHAREMSPFRPFSIMWTNSFRPSVTYGPVSFDAHVPDHFVPVIAKFELHPCNYFSSENQPFYLYREESHNPPLPHVVYNVVNKNHIADVTPPIVPSCAKSPILSEDAFIPSIDPKLQSTPKIINESDVPPSDPSSTPISLDLIKDEQTQNVNELDIDIRSPVPFDGPPYDIGDYVNKFRQLNVYEKHVLIDNLFRPDISFEFQKSPGENASFDPRWLYEFPWLTYSPSVDGAFCLPCLMFSESNAQKVLKTKPLLNWSKGAATLKKHHVSHAHLVAVNLFREFRIQRMYMLQNHWQGKYQVKSA